MPDLLAVVDGILVEVADDEGRALELLPIPPDAVRAKVDTAPYDDEPFNNDERQAVADALERPAIPWSEAQAEFDT